MNPNIPAFIPLKERIDDNIKSRKDLEKKISISSQYLDNLKKTLKKRCQAWKNLCEMDSFLGIPLTNAEKKERIKFQADHNEIYKNFSAHQENNRQLIIQWNDVVNQLEKDRKLKALMY